MAELMRLEVEGFEQLTDRMKVKVPETIRKMAFNLDANVGGSKESRRKELLQAHTLQMGYLQYKPRRGNHSGSSLRLNSAWDPDVGWVSIHRRAGNGASGYRMASFSWENVRKRYSVEAAYTNQLANLWANPTKPYTRISPYVGQWGTKRKRWKIGQSRPSKYDWSMTYSILQSSIPNAIKKTESKFKDLLD